MITAATTMATTVVTRRFTSGPIRSRREVKRIKGTSANGIPNDSTTCEITSVRPGLTPIATTTNAGAIVTSRRTVTGIRRWTKPCITTWPASVPTAEDERPEARSAIANSVADAGPRIGSSVRWAVSIESTLVRPWAENVDAAITSIERLISPATDIATITSMRV